MQENSSAIIKRKQYLKEKEQRDWPPPRDDFDVEFKWIETLIDLTKAYHDAGEL